MSALETLAPGGGDVSISASALPPLPRAFRSFDSTVTSCAQWLDEVAPKHPIFRRTNRGRTAAQKAGYRYERKVAKHLATQFPTVHLGRWIVYHDDGGRQFCQPDAVIERSDGCVLVVEIKYSSTGDAWWQLEHKYGPIVSMLYSRPVCLVNVVRNYIPETPWPDREAWPLRFDFDSLPPRSIVVYR